MADKVIYEDRTWNPLRSSVRLTTTEVKMSIVRMPPKELNVAAMADAYLRGRWLGGGGLERGLEQFPEGAGFVPVIRLSGSSAPFKVRQAAELVQHLGPWTVRACGGEEAVAASVRQAATEGVPLWIARRTAPGPSGDPLTVAVDRISARADVWGGDAPPVRLRGRRDYRVSQRRMAAQLAVSIGDSPATVKAAEPGTIPGTHGGQVTVQTDRTRWDLFQQDNRSSRLFHDGAPVACLTRPERPPDNARLLPLADVRYESPDPLEAVMAHFFAVSFGLGKRTGIIRFGFNSNYPPRDAENPMLWEMAWHTGLRDHGMDTGSGLEKIVETDHSHNRSEGG